MATSFGIDTLGTHLDLITWTEFQAWNRGLVPAFAGRNFLGGDFIWAPAEATNALTAPSPEDLSKLALSTPLIAPIQGAGIPATRQQVVDTMGTLFGRIDADAICRRLASAMGTKELTSKQSGLVNIYLQVDPTVPFSADYWAGWADTVFNSPFTETNPDGSEITTQPFLPCIMCHFSSEGAVLRIDPQVTAALQTARDRYRNLKTQCFGFWADAPSADPAMQRPNPQLDWSRFASTPAPIWVWRFATTLLNAAGQPVFAHPPKFAIDATNMTGTPSHFGWEFMLDTWEWQPSNSQLRYGFITDREDGITAGQIALIGATPLPGMHDLEGASGHYTFAGGPVKVIGRYLKPSVVNSAGHPGHFTMNRPEAQALSAANFELFTIWEDINALVGRQALDIRYFDPAVHAGTEDGRNAFKHCGETLRQPPYTAVFFAVDFDPEDPAFLFGVSTADAQTRIVDYFNLVKGERDAYAQAHPGRYYLIGVYGKSATLEWCYRDPNSAVSMFWQSASAGSSNRRPRRPWCHAHRWQIADQSQLDPTWGIVRGADPDVDWDDGGTWQLTTPLARQLDQAEDAAAAAALQRMINRFFPLFDLL